VSEAPWRLDIDVLNRTEEPGQRADVTVAWGAQRDQHGPRQGDGAGRAGPAYPPPGVSRSYRMASAAALSGARSLVTISQTRRSFTFG
jgi:hypothetical protein